MGSWRQGSALLGLLFLLLAAARSVDGRQGPAAGKCHPDCTKHGNCGEDGICKCPFGRMGDACEVDFLAPCRQNASSPAICGMWRPYSCECVRRCRKWFCREDAQHNRRCEFYGPPMDNTRCYSRDGVEPDKQYSNFPAEDEQGVKYFMNDAALAPETNRSVVAIWGELEMLPPSACNHSCHHRGYCHTFTWDQSHTPKCFCYRGYNGTFCENRQDDTCYLGCNGRGVCNDQFCHCKPPYFSIGCSRSKVYPANYSRPSPVNFKIYMYDLPTQLAYDNVPAAGWTQHDNIYIAYQQFMAQFLLNPVRTEDPSEANLFYIPAFTYGYSGNVGNPYDHLTLLLDYIRMKWPYWNRTEGRDHFVFTSGDRGACYVSTPGHVTESAIKLTHFGMYQKNSNWGGMSNPEYGCYNPIRDVLTLPYDNFLPRFYQHMNASVDELMAAKNNVFFVAGGVRPDDPEYSGGARKILFELCKKWSDTDFTYIEGGVGDYDTRLFKSKFCLAPYGHGFGVRLHQAIMTGCVPVIVAEHVYQPYEELIPYELFTVRLSNDDLPHLREILRGITDEQYRAMLVNLQRYRSAFVWDRHVGGQAFEYTIATLRRRYMNLKAKYF